MRIGKTLYIFQTILLIALVFFFYRELYILGLGIYQSISPKPSNLITLGNYYNESAKKNKLLADSIYFKATDIFMTQLSRDIRDEEKPKIQMELGRNYQCGRGVVIDLVKAKAWYDKAKSSYGARSDASEIVDQYEKLPCE